MKRTTHLDPFKYYDLKGYLPPQCDVSVNEDLSAPGHNEFTTPYSMSLIITQMINGSRVSHRIVLSDSEALDFKLNNSEVGVWMVPGYIIKRYLDQREEIGSVVPQGSADIPCPYSIPIINEFRKIISQNRRRYSHIHDCFAGAGERLSELADELGIVFTGTEIENAFIKSPYVKCGDSTRSDTYPTDPYAIVTSPVYPNGMADDHEARDGSRRHTYRAAIGTLLHRNNMGSKGYRGTKRGGNSRRRHEYWSLAEACVRNWTGAQAALVNVSDFIHTIKGETTVEPVTDDWINLLRKYGWEIVNVHKVATRRQRHGANGKTRTEYESIIEAIPSNPNSSLVDYPRV